MKIAITSQGTDLDSQVDPRFARARYFIVLDSNTGDFEAVDNSQTASAMHGAGPQAAMTISRHDVKVVLTGHCGPNAFQSLKAAGIQVITDVSGTVREAVEKFKAGELKSAEGADVQGHWM